MDRLASANFEHSEHTDFMSVGASTQQHTLD